MAGPCVRVPREDGERTRQELAAAGVLDHDREITAEGGTIYIPVTGEAEVPDGLAVVERALPDRETQTTPADLLAFEPGYERLGDIVILDEDDPDRAAAVADAVMESDIRAKTVLDRASKVKGTERIRDWEVLAGDGTETVHREYGAEFSLDIATVYFSPRLATERHRVVEQAEQGERAFDMFAGVGPYAVQLAMRGAETVGVDVNPDAVEYLRENARRNGVTDRVTALEGDVRELAPDHRGWADRVVMNLPHSADTFLEAAVTVAGEDCTLHYYDIQHEDEPFEPGVTAITEAAEPEYEVAVETERVVRSYAPHEMNVVLDVRLRKR